MAINAIKDLSAGDAGVGTLTYNGVDFGNLRKFNLTGDYVYDEPGRAVIGTRYTLDVIFYVYGATESATGANIGSVRYRLSQPGQQLRLTGVGLGDFIISGGSGAVQDLEWGPKPQRVVFNGVGGNLCWEVEWQCSFIVKDTSVTLGQIKSFTYERVDSFDDSGMCTRVISGTLEIPQTRPTNGSNRPTTSADQFRERIIVKIPRAFKRISQTFALSQDHARLDFVVVDQQQPGDALPPNIINADIEYSIENRPPGFSSFTASLAGTLEVIGGKSPSLAAQAFVAIALDKLTQLRKATNGKGVVIPERIRFGHKLFTRQSSFAMTFGVTHCLGDLLADGGIWTPIQGTSWESWFESVRHAWGVRGTAGLAHNPSEDAIIDLGTSNIGPIGNDGGMQNVPAQMVSQKFSFEVKEEVSWLGYENTLQIEREHPHAVHVPAEQFTPPSQQNSIGDKGEPTKMPPTVPAGTSVGATLQRRGKPIDRIVMIGKALRIGFKPSIPRLAFVKSTVVNEIETMIDGPKLIGCVFGQPIYQAQWRITYVATGGVAVEEIPPTTNPSLCCDDIANGAKK